MISKMVVKLQKSDYIFFSIVFVGFYLLNRFSPFIADDYWYRFLYDGTIGEYRQINSLSDAFISQAQAYMSHSGRFLVHTVVSYFCGVLGIGVFQLVNSIVFVLLCIGIVKLIRYEYGDNLLDKYIVVFILFLLMPCPGMILLGSIAMCVNYLWVSCATVYFFIFYLKIKDATKYYSKIGRLGIFITALLYGSLQESFTLGISAALFLYYCFHIKEYKSSVVWLTLGLWIGCAIVTFAPGNFVRLSEANNSQIQFFLIKSLSNFLLAILHAKIFLIMLLLSVVVMYRNFSDFRIFVQNNIKSYIVILVCFLVAFVSYSGDRQLTCIELCSLLLIMKLYHSFYSQYFSKYSKYISVSLSFILLLVYLPIYTYRNIAWNVLEKLHRVEVVEKAIVCPEYFNAIRKFQTGIISSNYTYLIDYSEKWMYEGLSCYKSDGKNTDLVTAILMEGRDCIARKYEKYNIDGVYFDKKNDYFVIKGAIGESVKVVREQYVPSSVFGKIRSYLLGNDGIDERMNCLSIYFDYDKNRYFVLNSLSYKILEICL